MRILIKENGKRRKVTQEGGGRLLTGFGTRDEFNTKKG